jgi:hypothetical protein
MTSPIQPPADFGFRGPKPRPNYDPEDFVFWERWEDEAIPPEEFMEVQPTLVPDAESASNITDVLAPEASPFLQSSAKHWVCAGRRPILLHRYDFLGFPLLVYEGRQDVVVRVSTGRSTQEDQIEIAQQLASKLLRLKVQLRFHTPVAPDELVRFDMVGVGAGSILPGALVIVGEKADRDMMSGRIVRNPHFLDGSLRDAWDTWREAQLRSQRH